MKRLVALTVTLLYLMLASGIAVNVHYCAGQISSIDFNFKKDVSCGCGERNADKGCCKDKQAYIKVKDSHQSAADIKVIPVAYDTFLLASELTTTLSSDLSNLFSLISISPHEYLKAELHIFIRILLI